MGGLGLRIEAGKLRMGKQAGQHSHTRYAQHAAVPLQYTKNAHVVIIMVMVTRGHSGSAPALTLMVTRATHCDHMHMAEEATSMVTIRSP